MDYSDVRSSDIVPGGVLHMTVWNMWRTLVEAVAGSDIEYVITLLSFTGLVALAFECGGGGGGMSHVNFKKG